MRRSRRAVLGAILLTFAVLAAACGDSGENGSTTSGDDEPKPELTVGSDNFAEAQIVGEMYAQVLENAGYTVNRQLDIEGREIRLPAMESGEIDIAPEYVASLLSVVNPDADLTGSVDELAAELEQPLSDMGLTLLEPSDVIDTNVFVVTQETADEFSLTSLSDLTDLAGDMTLGAPPECPRRPYCIPGLKEIYGVEFGEFQKLDYGPTITALQEGAIDVGLLFSTDGTIAEQGFVVLEDDQGLQSADNITPLVREEILTPEIEELLNSVSAALEEDAITELNKRANVDVEDPADLATEYLEQLGLL
jgi:osmoprotectant transport system substrate-binding protein